MANAVPSIQTLKGEYPNVERSSSASINTIHKTMGIIKNCKNIIEQSKIDQGLIEILITSLNEINDGIDAAGSLATLTRTINRIKQTNSDNEVRLRANAGEIQRLKDQITRLTEQLDPNAKNQQELISQLIELIDKLTAFQIDNVGLFDNQKTNLLLETLKNSIDNFKKEFTNVKTTISNTLRVVGEPQAAVIPQVSPQGQGQVQDGGSKSRRQTNKKKPIKNKK